MQLHVELRGASTIELLAQAVTSCTHGFIAGMDILPSARLAKHSDGRADVHLHAAGTRSRSTTCPSASASRRSPARCSALATLATWTRCALAHA